ncbi:MAG TPA: hypothetical protein VN324_02750 [Quisquiliibacterium sp.]|nr:hypothetical protein [Quisquiliibacterium sp.]
MHQIINASDRAYLMRTTLDIDEEVLAAAKELARRERKTTGQVISDLARRALTGSGLAGMVAEPVAAHGFRPFPARGPLVTNDVIDRLRDSEGV